MALSVDFYPSGAGNLGGTIGGTAIAVNASLFNGINAVQNFFKTPFYRCVYVKNNHATTTYTNVTVSVIRQGGTTHSDITIANAQAAPGTTAAATIGSEVTDPTLPSGASYGLSTPPMTFAPGQYLGLWIRRVGRDVQPAGGENGALASTDAHYTLSVIGYS